MIGCLDCARLRDENARLRREYGQDFAGSGDLVRPLGVTPAGARIALVLYHAGDWVGSHTLEKRLDIGVDTLKTQMCRLRKTVGRDAIETSYGIGYRMGAPMR